MSKSTYHQKIEALKIWLSNKQKAPKKKKYEKFIKEIEEEK